MSGQRRGRESVPATLLDRVRWLRHERGEGVGQVDGVVTIVQESRFQLVDDDGVAHLMILGALAVAEPDELEALARRQARVRVSTKPGDGVIAVVATAISLV